MHLADYIFLLSSNAAVIFTLICQSKRIDLINKRIDIVKSSDVAGVLIPQDKSPRQTFWDNMYEISCSIKKEYPIYILYDYEGDSDNLSMYWGVFTIKSDKFEIKEPRAIESNILGEIIEFNNSIYKEICQIKYKAKEVIHDKERIIKEISSCIEKYMKLHEDEPLPEGYKELVEKVKSHTLME